MEHTWTKIVLIVFLILSKTSFADTRSSLALFNLTPISMDAIGADADLLFSLETELDKSQSISVMSRRDMEAILYRIGGAQVSDTNKIMSYGLELGVNFVLAGEIDKTGSIVKINIKLVDISNNRVSQTWTESYNGRGDILQRSKLLAKAIEKTLIESSQQININDTDVSAFDYIIDLTAKSIDTGIQINWKISIDISVLYTNVYRGTSKNGPYEFVASVEETQFYDEVVGTFYYRLDLVLEDGREIKGTKTVRAKSSSNEAKVDLSLSPPTIMNHNQLVNGIKIDFIPQLNNQGVKGYNFYQKMSDNTWLKVHSINKDKKLNYSIVLDKNFKPKNHYSLAVTAFSNQGESTHSAPIKFTIPDLIVLSSDHKQQLRAANLFWKKSNVGTGYKVYRKKSLDDDWKIIKIITDTNKNEYLDKIGLEDGQEYIYTITLVDEFTESPRSQEIKILTKPTANAPNQFMTKGNLVKKVALTWQSINDVDISGYVIYRHEGMLSDGTRLTEVAFIEGYKSNNYIDGRINALKDGQDYHYAIAARNLFSADGKLTPTQTITTKPLPKSPVKLTLSTTKAAILIKWAQNLETDLKHYRLFRKWNNEPWQNIGDVTDTSLEDTNLKVYAKTYYKVSAIDLDGLESKHSTTKEVLSPLKLFLQVKEDMLLRTIVLSWQSVKHIDGYKLYQRNKTNLTWKLIKTLKNASQSEYKDFDKRRLKDGIEYEYRLSAFDKYNETTFSNIVIGRTKALPTSPTNFIAHSGNVKFVKLSWDSSKDADNKGYFIYRKNKSGKFEEIEKITKININTYIDDGEAFTDLSDGTKYEYKIATFNKYSVIGPFSQIISGTTKSIPETVKDLTIEKDKNGLMLFWQSSSNKDIKQYQIYRSKNKSCSSMKKIANINPNEDVYLDTNIESGTQYCYKVIVTDTDKLQSKFSLPVLFKTLPMIEESK